MMNLRLHSPISVHLQPQHKHLKCLLLAPEGKDMLPTILQSLFWNKGVIRSYVWVWETKLHLAVRSRQFELINWSLSKEWVYIDWISNAPHLTLFGLPLNCSMAICLLCLITADTPADPSLLYCPNPWGMHACKHSTRITVCSLNLHLSHPALLLIPTEIRAPRFHTHTPQGMHAHAMSYFPLTADSNPTSVGSRSWSLTQVYGWSTLRGPPAVG